MEAEVNLIRFVPLVLLFSSIALSQTPARSESNSVHFKLTPAQHSGCPVEIEGWLDVSGTVVPVPKPGGKGDKQKLHVTLSNSKTLEVRDAEISVHGFRKELRNAPAVLYSPDDPAVVSKTLKFNHMVLPGKDASADFVIRGFGSVTALDLDSVTYSDGTTWHSSGQTQCRALGELPLNSPAQ